MDDALLNIVLERLDQVSLPDQATGLLLSALEGDEELDRALDTGSGASALAKQLPGPDDTPAVEPAGAYLKSLTVSGFRGIGPEATLKVQPKPGLTLVAGRNGSGKSSFAEALEVLFTEKLLRWDLARSAMFRNGWQSKHAATGTEIKADVLIEGNGHAVAARSWPHGAGIADSQAWLQLDGQKRQPGLDGLGWAGDLKTYRPFLSHAELEAFFAEPHELYDLLASVLGLEELTTAAVRLNTARKQRDDKLTEVKKRLDPILGRLRALDDERAAACLAALSKRTWDLQAARETATGGGAPSSQLAALRQLKLLVSPSDSGVNTAVNELVSAAESLDNVAGTSAEQSRKLAQLLEAALSHHETHGDGDCPVCGQSAALTAQWREDTRQHVARLREEARAAEDAVASARKASDQALGLMQPPPPVLREDAEGVDVVSAREAWAAWAVRPADVSLASPEGLRLLAGHMTAAAASLAEAIAVLVATATAELARRDDQWAPLAADITAWCADAETAQRASQPVKALNAAKKWLTDATGDLRNQRLKPLADQSREIWGKLRQESNVDLGAFRLASSANRRNVELDVTIDGTPSGALGVMSQGEINALALSIFLPRATMKESPFRFLVIDDPVQAMDPAKVDGLARVLADVAATRQVIVFTHDNRLATAVKNLSIPATILEVTRRPRSEVHVRPCQSPVYQALKDAEDLTKDHKVPNEVVRSVVPGLCRTALEAAFIQAFWRQQLRAKKSRSEIDEALTGTRTQLTHVAALGICGDSRAGEQVLPTLNRWGGRAYGDTYQALNKAAHQPYPGDVGELIKDTRSLITKIEEKLQ